MNKVLVICGATATGKTDLAVECALKLKTEIISADSQLIYKGLDIGTAKPTKSEMRGVTHHMIDIIEPIENYSVFEYAERAERIINGLTDKGKMPIICGGTGFYINSLLFELSYGRAAANDEIRKKYENYLINPDGKQELYNKLCSCDPETAKKLHVNDVKRVIRALEIFEISGVKKSSQNDGQKNKRNYFAIAINFPREELYERINYRVDKMFERGLVEEVKNLLDSGIDEKYQCMQAIGYKEVVSGIKNGINRGTMRDIIKQNTRHYAKRQITFFKKLPGLTWLTPKEASAKTVLEIYNG